jgi:hypothetical protein
MARRELLGLSGRPSEPPIPEPGPIAVIAAGVPIEDVIAQLRAIQGDHLGAQVRQGKRNRWEIWPPQHAPDLPPVTSRPEGCISAGPWHSMSGSASRIIRNPMRSRD